MSENIVQWGIKKLAFAVRNDDGSYGTPVMHPGAITLNVSASNNADNILSADDGPYYNGNGASSKTGELTVAKFRDWFLTNILGHIVEDGGIGEGDGVASKFAMLYEVNSDQGGSRYVWYECTAGPISQNHATTTADGTITYATETSTITSSLTELPGDIKRRIWKCPKGSEFYDSFFDAVHIPGQTAGTAPKLSALSIGALTLTPAFDADTTTYTATTTNASDAVSFTAPLGVTVAATANGTAIANGDSVTWSTGDNTVTISLTGATATTTYTVTVTKE